MDRGENACRFTNDDSPLQVQMIIEKTVMEKGSFKVAYKGYCAGAKLLPGFKSALVCAKQAFEHVERRTGEPQPKKVKLPVYEKLVGLLKMELRTHAWASALLEDVYAFIQNRKPEVLFRMPQFRFVRAALAEDEKKHHAFLIEEGTFGFGRSAGFPELLERSEQSERLVAFLGKVQRSESQLNSSESTLTTLESSFLSFLSIYKWMKKLSFITIVLTDNNNVKMKEFLRT